MPDRGGPDRSLGISVEQLGDTRVITLRGFLDARGADRVAQAVSQRPGDDYGLLAFDLGSVDDADTAGVRALARVADRARAAGKQPVAVAAQRPVVDRIERAGLRERLPVAVERRRAGHASAARRGRRRG